MPHRALTPETVFKPSTEAGNQPVFMFAGPSVQLSEHDQYKRLIDVELTRQGLPLAHLADRLSIRRTHLHKIIRQNGILTDIMRDRLFENLAIDHVRAKFCIVMLRDYTAYGDQAAFIAAEGLKGFYCEVATCRSGELHVELRPAIIHTALRRAYELLLSHQDRVIEQNQNLQA
jgi:hypothetical protein